PRGREVVRADRARLGLTLTEQLHRHQRIERVLELASTREGPLQVAREPEHPGLVIHRVVGAVGQPVDAVDAAAQAEAQAVPEVERHRLAPAERLALGGAAERDLEADRGALLAVPRLESEEERQVALQLAGLAIEDAVGRRRDQRAMSRESLLAQLAEPRAVL